MRPNEFARKILLSGEITDNNIKETIEKIIQINQDDEFKLREYIDWERKPIKLYINSFGGSIYDGLALIDIIKQSITPVHTIAIGSCMSTALWIYLVGKERYVGENSILMYHDISSMVYDKTQGIKQELNQTLYLQKMFNDAMTKNSLVKQDTLDDIINRKSEWYINSKEALELKLADSYYKENI